MNDSCYEVRMRSIEIQWSVWLICHHSSHVGTMFEDGDISHTIIGNNHGIREDSTMREYPFLSSNKSLASKPIINEKTISWWRADDILEK